MAQKQNPSVIFMDAGYAIRFTRRSWTVLTWLQDLSGRKMKSAQVDRPVVIFTTREAAEKEVREVVIPYLQSEKAVNVDEIVGW